MPMTQMNTRISKQLKEQGDAALLRAGYSPSEAVRLLWTQAAALMASPNKIRMLLEGGKEGASPYEHGRENPVLAGSHLVEAFRIANGIAAPAGSASEDDEMLKEAAIWERYESKGLV